MIISMPTTGRPRQRSDHRLRNLVQRTGDVTVASLDSVTTVRRLVAFYVDEHNRVQNVRGD
jgi:hypothetical protein